MTDVSASGKMHADKGFVMQDNVVDHELLS